MRRGRRSITPGKAHAIAGGKCGFDWGYTGSKPALLALAILIETTDHETALRHQAEFETYFLSSRTEDTWEIDVDDIIEWVANQKGHAAAGVSSDAPTDHG